MRREEHGNSHPPTGHAGDEAGLGAVGVDQVGLQAAQQGGEAVEGGQINHRRGTPYHREQVRVDTGQLEARQIPCKAGVASQTVGHIDIPAGALHPEGQLTQMTACPADGCL